MSRSLSYEQLAQRVKKLEDEVVQLKHREEILRQNEERLTRALDAAGIGTWSRNISENRITWDANMHLLFGLPPGMFSGNFKDYLNVLHPDDRQRVKAEISKALQKDLLYKTEYRVLWPDGSIHYIADHGKVCRDNKGRALWMVGVCWDITNRKQVEKALKESEKKFRTAADFTHNWEYWIDPAGNYVYISPSCERITGYGAEEFKQDKELILSIIHPADRPRIAEHLEKDLES